MRKVRIEKDTLTGITRLKHVDVDMSLVCKNEHQDYEECCGYKTCGDFCPFFEAQSLQSDEEPKEKRYVCLTCTGSTNILEIVE